MSVCQTSVLVRWKERENWTPCAVHNYIKAVCVDVGRSMGHITSDCAICVLGHVCIVCTVSVFVCVCVCVPERLLATHDLPRPYWLDMGMWSTGSLVSVGMEKEEF